MATRPKRKPTKGKSPPARARRSLLAARPRLRKIALEPHQIDILALALIAVGVFLGGVEYAHSAGGAVGDGVVRATKFCFGVLGDAVPAALVAGGGPPRPWAAAGCCSGRPSCARRPGRFGPASSAWSRR